MCNDNELNFTAWFTKFRGGREGGGVPKKLAQLALMRRDIEVLLSVSVSEIVKFHFDQK